MPQLEVLFLIFAAIVTAAYWVVGPEWRPSVLITAGALFLYYLDPISLLLLAGLTIITFVSAHSRRNNLMVLGFLVILFCSIRIWMLYWSRQQILAPLLFIGFSFYFLKFIHYVLEMRAGTFRPHKFLDFFAYMFFYPTLAIGPIHRFEDFLKSQRRMRWNSHMFAGGLERILYGYAKVILLANYFVSIWMVSFAMKVDSESGLRVLLDSMVYGFHLYFAFAGYSDIAIGLSALLGYQICENFDRPFLKRNIGEFWQSWHMSLSSWCRQYVFLSVYSTWRNLGLALLASMIAIGVWHEFSLRYIFWGFYHGMGLLIWRLYQRYLHGRIPLPPERWILPRRIFSIGLTFAFVMVGFTITRSANLSEIMRNFQLLFLGP